MHPKERVLELARLCEMQGRAVPVDLLAEADELGIQLTALDQPPNSTYQEQSNAEKESIDGIKTEIQNITRNASVPLVE